MMSFVHQLSILASLIILVSSLVPNAKLSSLPKDISPFEKSSSKSRDVQGEFRQIAQGALLQALKDGVKQIELEFPPLLGGEKSKSQFDDFDNIQELNQNRDWCLQLTPDLSARLPGPIWFLLPDLKEVELAKEEWTGRRYRDSCKFTSIEAVTDHYASQNGGSSGDASYAKPWGASFASGMNQLFGGGTGDAGLLGDQNALDELEGTPALHLVCQPGNGGPVEDWINVEKVHKGAGGSVATCIVNGALDKVRSGYYNAFVFPALAKTFPFYGDFEAAFFLKPISDKGVYGWIYRVYPEPWQIVWQRPYQRNGQVCVEDVVALVSDDRPSYNDCVKALLAKAQDQAN